MKVTLYEVVNETAYASMHNPLAGVLFFTLEAAQKRRTEVENELGVRFALRACGTEVDINLPFVVAEDGSIEPLYEELPRYDTILTTDHRIVAINPDSIMWDEEGVPEFVQDWNGTWYNDCDIAYYVGTDEDITTDVLVEAWGLGIRVPVNIEGIAFSEPDVEVVAFGSLEEMLAATQPAEDEDFATVPVTDYPAPTHFDDCFECDDTDCPANPAYRY